MTGRPSCVCRKDGEGQASEWLELSENAGQGGTYTAVWQVYILATCKLST